MLEFVLIVGGMAVFSILGVLLAYVSEWYRSHWREAMVREGWSIQQQRPLHMVRTIGEYTLCIKEHVDGDFSTWELSGGPTMGVYTNDMPTYPRRYQLHEQTLYRQIHLRHFAREGRVLSRFLQKSQHSGLDVWRRTAEHHELVLQGGLVHTGGSVRLKMSGRIENIPTTVMLRLHNRRPRTHLTATLSRRLPSRIRIHANGKRRNSLRIGDPILDGTLTIEGDNAAAARELLSDDALRPLLLEALHPHPGSMVQDNTISIVVEGFVGEGLPEHVARLVDLATALNDRLSHLSGRW